MRTERRNHRSLERRIGTVVGWGTTTALLLYPVLLIDPVELSLIAWTPYLTAAGLGTLLSTALHARALRRRVPRHLRHWLDYVWVGSLLTTIAVAISFSGTATSELHYLLALPLLFSAVVFRPLVLMWLGAYALTALCTAYVLTDAGPLPARTLVRAVTVGGSVASVAWLTEALRRRLEESRTARREAHDLAESLTTVAVAATTVNTLEPDVVLRSLLAATIGVGYRAAAVLHGDGEVIASAGERDDLRRLQRADDPDVTSALHVAWDGDFVERGWDGDGAVVRCVPITSDAESVGLLVAVSDEASTDARNLGLQILAAQAGNALGNVQRFEDEQNLVQRMQAFEEMQHDLISTASHELRTPVTVVKGVAELLGGRWDELGDDQRRELAGRIRPHVQALEEVLDRLSDLMQIQSATGPELHPASVDLAHLVARSIDATDGRLGERLVLTNVASMTVEVDPTAVHQVLVELLDNIAVHSGPDAVVRITAAADDDTVTLAITNDEVQLHTEDVEQLVRPFARAGDVLRRTSRGLGVGLTFVDHVVARHGGSMEIDADASTFTVRISLPGRTDRPLAATNGDQEAVLA